MQVFMHATVTWVGILFEVFGGVLAAVGENLIRQSFLVETRKALNEQRPVHRRPLWVTGMTTTILLNPVCNVIALLCAPAATVQPFACIHIVANVFLSGWISNQPATAGVIVWTMMIMTGLLAVMQWGAHASTSATLKALVDMLVFFRGRRPSSVLFLWASLTVITCAVALLRRSSAISAVRMVKSLCTGLAPGLLAGGAAVGLKSLLMVITAQQDHVFNGTVRFFLALYLGVFTVGLAGVELIFVNIAAAQLPTTFTVPVFSGTMMLVGSLGGILLFNEETADALGYGTGMILIFLGMVFLAMEQEEDPAEQMMHQGGHVGEETGIPLEEGEGERKNLQLHGKYKNSGGRDSQSTLFDERELEGTDLELSGRGDGSESGGMTTETTTGASLASSSVFNSRQKSNNSQGGGASSGEVTAREGTGGSVSEFWSANQSRAGEPESESEAQVLEPLSPARTNSASVAAERRRAAGDGSSQRPPTGTSQRVPLLQTQGRNVSTVRGGRTGR
uniref:Uncharacterized protein n=1 Tax=Chromera velia CCMP2878 TaxID=1169474 RepID=A0A0G4G2D9_9ALVE|eukprot:Cvel_19896.t1-p1 / transcript=Cvel_19896.t1 / gene=Cvel_19896 / organism=Chromera_velia_CCMP2878 / gene_product=hypothetical protein / transcript_product=hypothetical protein / location=Cvel_scaffold1747:1972-4827(-) / protein_length=506 / sequence_SO=supercontig / SO=protein_coding / is_pseudo=false